ncbi:MAG: Crp/Fnr family transcriptional regulator [Amaricoccus sp.]|uniref:Crp/Fnr family transcriptional regulator n=1 Tax=Amaricoccus sp. TaxID=1872485 RepID=UPI0039E6F1E4
MSDLRIRELSEAVLRGHGWLSHQSDSLADEVLRRGLPQRFGPNSEIFRPGDPAGGVYAVVDGLVVLTVAPVGLPRALVQHVGIGTWLGALPFFGETQRATSLRAVNETVLFHLPLRAMEAIVSAEPRALRAFGEIAADDGALWLRVVEDLLQPDTGRRVAATLLRATRDGRVRVPLTQLDLATMANASRRQVNTVLQGFASRGWIAQGYGSVTVLDAEGLRRSLEDGGPAGADTGRRMEECVGAYSPPPSVLT